MAMLHSLIARRWIGRQTQCWSRPKVIHLVGWDRSFRLLLGPPGLTDYLFLLQIFSGVV